MPEIGGGAGEGRNGKREENEHLGRVIFIFSVF
jgi:hypothetical protein